MLVFGDQSRHEPTVQLIERLALDRAALRALPAETPHARHTALVRMLLDAGELAQGLLDAEFRRHRADVPSRIRALVGDLTSEIASRVAAWPRTDTNPPRLAALDELLRARLPDMISVTIPEGYAFYALYPELYASAALALRARSSAPLTVIGIRSVGTSLAPIVAAAAGGDVLFATIRPTGPPSARTIAISDELARPLFSQRAERTFAVVDEGPMLPGSALAAVGDWLERRGVLPERVTYLPSHAGTPAPRGIGAGKLVRPFDDHFLRRAVMTDIDAPTEDIGAGRWRAKVFAREDQWPPVSPERERRKYLFSWQGRRWLLKFAGIGRYGDEKLARASWLGRLGFVPKVSGLRHGFLLAEWQEGTPIWKSDTPVDREQLLERISAYLGALASFFPAPPSRQGATPAKLLEMARHNTQLALGPAYARALRRWHDQLAAITRRGRHAFTDNKMHAWEWLVTDDGLLLKCDALDHHGGPDLVGPQDLGWDVAAAQIELELSDAEARSLVERVARQAKYPALAAQIDFFAVAYLAFQVGQSTLASELAEGDPVERARLREATRRYTALLKQRIEA